MSAEWVLDCLMAFAVLIVGPIAVLVLLFWLARVTKWIRAQGEVAIATTSVGMWWALLSALISIAYASRESLQ